MNNIEVIESKRPTNLEEIAEFEKLIGATLPDDYKQFLLKHNGGHPVMASCDLLEAINEDNLAIDIDWFYALHEGDISNLSKKFKYSRDRLTNEYIPIACDNDGWLCIAIKGENYGKVYYLTTNWSYWKEEDLNYIYLVANTFTDFINGLYNAKLEKDGTWTITYQDGRVEKKAKWG